MNPRHPPQRDMVSVIVPSRNAARYLDDALRSLREQDFAGRWEVIVVDNGSTDESIRIARSYCSELNLTVLEAPDRANASYARNMGVRHCSGDKLIFVDADDEVEPHYLTAMAAALDHDSYVTSRVNYAVLNAPWVRDAHGQAWGPDDISVFFDFLPATGTNLGVRRQIFEAVGGFPEEFTGSQDIALSWRIQLLTRTSIRFVPDAVYRYRYRNTLPGLYRQTRNWGFSNTLLYKKFSRHGMPRRRVATGVREWRDVLVGLWKARTLEEKASLVARLGYCVGRATGSIRHRVMYF